MTQNTVTYSTIFPPASVITGIRQDAGPDRPVLITGARATVRGEPLQALLYRGPLQPMDKAGYISILPSFSGQTVTSSTFYGPNTALFNPELGAGNFRVVGSYSTSETGLFQRGMMYQGAADGSGVWTQINVPDDLAGGTVANTILHSTMGDIVVGNYDLQGRLMKSGNAFIYNTKTGVYTLLKIGKLATAYGVWQNGGSGSSAYTIAGGCGAGAGLNQGFLLDYDAATGAFTNLSFFNFNNKPGLGTHFEGISGVPGGYSMAATGDGGAAYATIARDADGTFGEARWLAIANPESEGICTANSVMDNKLIGVYHPEDGGIRGYLAVVSPGV